MNRFFCIVLVMLMGNCYAAHCMGNDVDLLFHYIEQKKSSDVKKIVKEKGISPDCLCPSKRMTPLQCAAQVGEVSVFKYLLKRSAIAYKSENTLDEHERALFEIAQRPGRRKILSALQKKLR